MTGEQAVHNRRSATSRRVALLVLTSALTGLVPFALARGECLSLASADLATAAGATSSAYLARADDVAVRSHDLALATGGISAAIGLRPSLGVGDTLDPEEGLDALDLIGYQFDASVGYRYDEVAIVRARAALLTAESRLEAQGVADVLEALLTLSRLRVAERALEAAAADLTEAAAALDRAEQTAAERAADPDFAPLVPTEEVDTGPAPFLREARLQLRRAELSLQDAEAAVAALGVVLSSLGVAAPTDPAADCGVAPLAEPDRAGATDRARSALEEALALARAQLDRALWGPVRDVRLQAQFQEGGARATASLGVATGRPEADLALRWRPTGKDGWSVRLSANLRLDDGTLAAIERAERAVLAAEADLIGYGPVRTERLNASRRAVERAWAEIEVLEEALQLAVLKRDDPAEARNLPRNVQAVARALDARERGLQAYYRAYAANLTTEGSRWPGP